MKKNVAGQAVGCQMTTAADGSDFTGAVTCYVTLDAGTQAVGTVASGACTHEGHGYHTYAPAQAETNGDLCAFTFVGTGALTSTVQVYTSFPQTGDSYARIGAAGAGLTSLGDARLANLDAAVSTRSTYAGADTAGTTTLLSRLTAGRATGLDNLDATVSSRLAPTTAGRTLDVTATGEAGIDWANIGGATTAQNLSGTTISTSQAVASVSGAVGSVTGAVGSVTGNVGGSVASVAAGGITASSFGAGAIDAAAIDATADTEIANAVLAAVVEGTTTVKQSLQLSNAGNAGLVSGAATTTVAVTGLDNTTTRIQATVDADGNRTAVTRTYS